MVRAPFSRSLPRKTTDVRRSALLPTRIREVKRRKRQRRSCGERSSWKSSLKKYHPLAKACVCVCVWYPSTIARATVPAFCVLLHIEFPDRNFSSASDIFLVLISTIQSVYTVNGKCNFFYRHDFYDALLRRCACSSLTRIISYEHFAMPEKIPRYLNFTPVYYYLSLYILARLRAK